MTEMKSKIIKKSVTTRPDLEYGTADSASPLIEGEVYEASQIAKDLVQKAERQANEILAAANQERDRIYQEARESGYQEGMAQATEWVVRGKDYYQKTLETNRNDLKILAIKIAEKIIGRGLEIDPEIINDIVIQALRTLRQQKNVIVRCNEEDFKTLEKNEKEFLDVLGQNAVIDFLVDSKIERGGCRVESEIGIVDARLETQLRTLQKILLTK